MRLGKQDDFLGCCSGAEFKLLYWAKQIFILCIPIMVTSFKFLKSNPDLLEGLQFKFKACRVTRASKVCARRTPHPVIVA